MINQIVPPAKRNDEWYLPFSLTGQLECWVILFDYLKLYIFMSVLYCQIALVRPRYNAEEFKFLSVSDILTDNVPNQLMEMLQSVQKSRELLIQVYSVSTQGPL